MVSKHRLQLGTSRLELLSPAARRTFVDASWIHLGDGPPPQLKTFAKMLLRRGPGFSAIKQMYRQTEFRTWFWRDTDALPFDDGQFTFIFSEHFFEHLPQATGIALMKECWRVLRPGGVLRTVVPDADLRTYEAPEELNFPANAPAGSPAKHKMRWSVYSLSAALRDCGFQPVALDYCTTEKTHVQKSPADIAGEYGECADWETVRDLSYISRRLSLIVDGVKRGS